MQVLTDQEFTYRKSPAEQDGYGKFKALYGNTLVWNQLVQNGNFAENIAWNGFGGTYSNADNVATLTATSASATQGISAVRTRVQAPANHILLLKLDIKSDNANALFGVSLNTNSLNTNNVFSSKHASTSWETWSAIITPTVNVEGVRIATYTGGLLNVGEKLYLRNVNLFDLTAMFDAGNEPSTVEEFTSLFPLSYYSFNQGSLLSFNGNGIKTVGKNLVFKTIPNSSINGSGAIISTSNFQMSVAQVLKGKEYVITTNDNSKKVLGFYYEEPAVGSVSYNGERVDDSSSYTFTSPITGYVAFRSLGGYSTPMLEFGTTATSYEPYTSSTLSLPISTYFPNGMDGINDAYDELSNSGYAKRMGRIDLGSITYTREESQVSGIYFFVGPYNSIPNIKTRSNALVWNIKAPLYETVSASNIYLGRAENKTIGGYDGRTVRIRDDSFTDATEFKNSLSGQYLVYELAKPIETPITTPQSKDEYPFFKSYKGGTEQLLPENGSVPVTAPILADMNYSSGAIEVTTYPNPEQGGETSGDGWYLVGEEATVNALPNEHYAFNNWVLDGEIVSTDPEYTFEVQDE